MQAPTSEVPTTSRRLHNFSAGPAVLPESVLEEVRDELPLYDAVGSSVLEISHRSAAYDKIDQSAKERMKKLLGMGAEWTVMFLQGGASMQFYQVPLNLLGNEDRADYIVTGAWSQKAVKEAKLCGSVNIAGTSEDENFSYIPGDDDCDYDPSAVYLHYTSNNTIFGTQFVSAPQTDVPLVCDASSDFLSRPIDIDRHGLIYAGAQKNIGPAGVTAVMVREDLLEDKYFEIPAMLDYRNHLGDLYNTPPVFAVYMVEKVMRWLEDQGGLTGIQQVNERKGRRLYEAIDRTGFYRGTARKDSRSLMNVCFRLKNEDLESTFIAEAKEAGLLQLKGHRSVGGIRASIYNACPEESVDALISFMDEFERTRG